MLNFDRQLPHEPEPSINWADPWTQTVYSYALHFWDESLDKNGDPIGPDFSAYDIIGKEIQAQGFDGEVATLIADSAYRDIVELRTGKFNVSS